MKKTSPPRTIILKNQIEEIAVDPRQVSFAVPTFDWKAGGDGYLLLGKGIGGEKSYGGTLYSEGQVQSFSCWWVADEFVVAANAADLTKAFKAAGVKLIAEKSPRHRSPVLISSERIGIIYESSSKQGPTHIFADGRTLELTTTKNELLKKIRPKTRGEIKIVSLPAQPRTLQA